LDLTKLGGDADWFSTQSVLVLGKPEDAPETLEQMQQELAKGSRDRLGFICDKRLKICGRREVVPDASMLLYAHDPSHPLYNKPRPEPVSVLGTTRVY